MRVGEGSEAFGEGSDARLKGIPVHFNPYNRSEMGTSHTYWDMGWRHVDSFWGVDAKWPVRRLPEVFPNIRGQG